MANLFANNNTPESVRRRFYESVQRLPQITIGEILRSLTGAQNPEKLTFKEVFLKLADLDSVEMAAVMGAQVGKMVGTISADEMQAKAIADRVHEYLSRDNLPHTKEDIIAGVFPGVDLKNDPQTDADLKEAYRMLYIRPDIRRFNSDGTAAEKKWKTMQVISPDRPKLPPSDSKRKDKDADKK